MTNVAVIGSQWGDEGKGKIVDWLSERADLIVRSIRWSLMGKHTNSACCRPGLYDRAS